MADDNLFFYVVRHSGMMRFSRSLFTFQSAGNLYGIQNCIIYNRIYHNDTCGDENEELNNDEHKEHKRIYREHQRVHKSIALPESDVLMLKKNIKSIIYRIRDVS